MSKSSSASSSRSGWEHLPVRNAHLFQYLHDDIQAVTLHNKIYLFSEPSIVSLSSLSHYGVLEQSKPHASDCRHRVPERA